MSESFAIFAREAAEQRTEIERLTKALHSRAEALMMQTNEIESLRQQLAECERDARRYRWFREVIPNVIFDSTAKTIELRTTLTLRDWDWNGEQLDAAIDITIAKLGADKTGENG